MNIIEQLECILNYFCKMHYLPIQSILPRKLLVGAMCYCCGCQECVELGENGTYCKMGTWELQRGK